MQTYGHVNYEREYKLVFSSFISVIVLISFFCGR